MSGLPIAIAGFYILLAVVPGTIAVISWRNRSNPGAEPLVLTAACAGTASLVQAGRFLESAYIESEPVAISLHIGLLVSINAAVLGAMYIAIEYTNRSELLGQWLHLGLVVAAVILPVGRILGEATGSGLAGPIADADFLYRVLVAGTGLVLFGRQYLGSHGVYRKQAAALCLGLAIGAGFGLVERFLDITYVEFTILGMIGGCVILGVALFRYEILDTAPLARETLFDHVSDPVIALGGGGHIADANRAAKATFGIRDDDIGRQASHVLPTEERLAAVDEELGDERPIGGIIFGDNRYFDPEHPVIAAFREGTIVPETEFVLVTDGDVRHYAITSTALPARPEDRDQLVVFREVTAERERAQDLDILKQVLSRVLRHNLRNEITVIRGFASTIAARGDEETTANAERIVDRTNVLLKTSETARRIKKVIEHDELLPVSLSSLVDRAVERAQSEYSDATIETDVPDVSVLVNPEFDSALDELFDNAISHNEGDSTVSVTATRASRGIELVIADNGPGIKDHELDVLKSRGETALDHGSGAGLWLIQTAVEHSNGSCEFDTGPDGTTITIRLQEASDESGV